MCLWYGGPYRKTKYPGVTPPVRSLLAGFSPSHRRRRDFWRGAKTITYRDLTPFNVNHPPSSPKFYPATAHGQPGLGEPGLVRFLASGTILRPFNEGLAGPAYRVHPGRPGAHRTTSPPSLRPVEINLPSHSDRPRGRPKTARASWPWPRRPPGCGHGVSHKCCAGNHPPCGSSVPNARQSPFW